MDLGRLGEGRCPPGGEGPLESGRDGRAGGRPPQERTTINGDERVLTRLAGNHTCSSSGRVGGEPKVRKPHCFPRGSGGELRESAASMSGSPGRVNVPHVEVRGPSLQS